MHNSNMAFIEPSLSSSFTTLATRSSSFVSHRCVGRPKVLVSQRNKQSIAHSHPFCSTDQPKSQPKAQPSPTSPAPSLDIPESDAYNTSDLPESSKNALKVCVALSLLTAGLPLALGIHDYLADVGVAGDPSSSLLAHILAYSTHYTMISGVSIFAVIHSGLASLRATITRDYLNNSERLYRVIFALASIPSAVLLIAYFISHRYDGPFLLSVHPSHNFTYSLTIVAFLFLYPATFNLLEVAAIQRPTFRFYERAITRITRHPQLVGQTLWGLSHSLHLGSSFSIVTAMALVSYHCFAVWNGDRRLFRKYGPDWLEYAERTSIIPFAAVLSGKQQLKIREFIVPAYVGVVLAAMGFYAAHPFILSTVPGLHL